MDGLTEEKWRVLSSEYLSRKPWFTVRHESLELPNGNRIPDYYVLEYPEWVNVIAVTPEDRLVLVRQYRHALGRIGFELCAGVCEKEDASILDSAKRELAEETGYGGGMWEEYMVLSANPATHTNLTHTFLARGVTPRGEAHPEETEFLSVHLFSPDEVRAMLERGEIMQSLMAAPLWKFLAREG